MKDPFDWLLLIFAAFVMFMWTITTPVKAEEASYCFDARAGLYVLCNDLDQEQDI